MLRVREIASATLGTESYSGLKLFCYQMLALFGNKLCMLNTPLQTRVAHNGDMVLLKRKSQNEGASSCAVQGRIGQVQRVGVKRRGGKGGGGGGREAGKAKQDTVLLHCERWPARATTI